MVKVGRFLRLAFLICLLSFVASAQDWQVVDSQTIAPGVFYQALKRVNPPTWVGVVRIPLPLPKELVLTPVLGGNNGFGRQPFPKLPTLSSKAGAM